MKNTSKYLFFIMTLLLLSCIESNKPNVITANNSKMELIIKTKDLFFWYKNNYDTISKIQLVKFNHKDSLYIYRIDFDNVSLYIDLLRKSEMFSSDFLDDKEMYFKQVDENLQKINQNDGPPAGLEYDLLLLTQEPDYYLRNYSVLNYQLDSLNRVIVDSNLIFEYEEKSQKIDTIELYIKELRLAEAQP